MLDNNQTSIATIQGKHRKKVWMNIDDIVLVETNFDGKGTCIIIQKYNNSHVKQLKDRKLLKFLDEDNEDLYDNCSDELTSHVDDPLQESTFGGDGIEYGDDILGDISDEEDHTAFKTINKKNTDFGFYDNCDCSSDGFPDHDEDEESSEEIW